MKLCRLLSRGRSYYTRLSLIVLLRSLCALSVVSTSGLPTENGFTNNNCYSGSAACYWDQSFSTIWDISSLVLRHWLQISWYCDHKYQPNKGALHDRLVCISKAKRMPSETGHPVMSTIRGRTFNSHLSPESPSCAFRIFVVFLNWISFALSVISVRTCLLSLTLGFRFSQTCVWTSFIFFLLLFLFAEFDKCFHGLWY